MSDTHKAAQVVQGFPMIVHGQTTKKKVRIGLVAVLFCIVAVLVIAQQDSQSWPEELDAVRAAPESHKAMAFKRAPLKATSSDSGFRRMISARRLLF